MRDIYGLPVNFRNLMILTHCIQSIRNCLMHTIIQTFVELLKILGSQLDYPGNFLYIHSLENLISEIVNLNIIYSSTKLQRPSCILLEIKTLKPRKRSVSKICWHIFSQIFFGNAYWLSTQGVNQWCQNHVLCRTLKRLSSIKTSPMTIWRFLCPMVTTVVAQNGHTTVCSECESGSLPDYTWNS